jgi:hypothetical protein
MNAAICCPGPSLRETWRGREGYDTVIAVNRAALVVECDVWAAVDYWPTIKENHAAILGNPALFTSATTWGDIRGKFREFTLKATAEDVEQWFGRRLARRRTMPLSLMLAGFIGATHVDIYGDDKTPAPDFDGHKNEDTMLHRNPGRWADEQADCDAITAFLNARGVQVCRRNTAGSTVSHP